MYKMGQGSVYAIGIMVQKGVNLSLHELEGVCVCVCVVRKAKGGVKRRYSIFV